MIADQHVCAHQLALFSAPCAAPVEDIGSPCFECGVDTLEIGEFYMVTEAVWLAAVPWDTEGGMFNFLCIGCLERRLGRTLVRGDFTNCLLNTRNRCDGAASSQLRVRLQGREAAA